MLEVIIVAIILTLYLAVPIAAIILVVWLLFKKLIEIIKG
jgi:hypothetical protein